MAVPAVVMRSHVFAHVLWASYCIGGLLLLLFFATALALGHDFATALLVVLINMYCLVIALRGMGDRELLSPLTLYASLVWLHFGIPGLFQTFQQDPFVNQENWLFARQALLFVLLSLFAIHAGCVVANRMGTSSVGDAKGAPRVWVPNRVLLAITVLVVSGFVVRWYIISVGAYFQIARAAEIELAGPLQAVIRTTELFPMYALMIYALYHYSPTKPPFRNGVILVVLVLLEMIYWLPSGRKEQVLLTLLIPLFARYLQRRETPSLAVVAAFTVFLLVFFPISYYYRYAIEVGGLLEQSPLDIASKSFDAAITTDIGDVGPFKVLLERLALLESVAACLRLIESSSWSPLAGTSYLDGLIILVPRILWPGKPDFHYGTDFGQAAGINAPTDWVTSISVTFVGEAFLNFAWYGAVVMGLMACAFSLLYRASRRGELSKMLYLVSLPMLLYIGGTFALYFGGLVKLLAMFLVLGTWITARRCKHTGI